MYCAKKAKQGYAFCSSEQIHANSRRLILEQSLRKALAQDCYTQDFELQMFYQAKLCLKTNKTIGYEALMRWHHTELGAISPIEFIPLAEETGLIVELRRAILPHEILGTPVAKYSFTYGANWISPSTPCVRFNFAQKPLR